jgi:lysyl-tRNA synthetase class 2
MREVDQFLQAMVGTAPAQWLSYQAAFLAAVGCDPHLVSLPTLQECAARHGISAAIGMDSQDRDLWLQLLMNDCIEPTLGFSAPVFIYDFPTSQAALARIRPGHPPLASRFEVYIAGMEIANGFHELADSSEQAARFSADLDKRRALGLPEIPIDHDLLAALEQGLPDCAGVAVGLDRLLMVKAKTGSIGELLSFPLIKP